MRDATSSSGRARPPFGASHAVRGTLSQFFLKAIPIFLVVRERGETAVPTLRDVTGSWRAVGDTVRRARAVPGLLRFIVARFFYTDLTHVTKEIQRQFSTWFANRL